MERISKIAIKSVENTQIMRHSLVYYVTKSSCARSCLLFMFLSKFDFVISRLLGVAG